MNPTTSHKKVPLAYKIAFGIGMLANQMFPAILGIFMVVLINDLGFSTLMWGIIFFAPRIFDAVTDPIMGFISDNTRSKWGRRRQYVFVGAIIAGISYILMWQIYREDGLSYNFTYFMLWSLVFYLGMTIFGTPYVAMGYEMSEDFHERTQIMAIAQWIGQWAWVIAPWFWVIMYDKNWFPDGADAAVRELAIWVGLFCLILAIVPAIVIKSASTLNATHFQTINLKNIGNSFKEILRGAKIAFANTEFKKLCYATFLVFNSFNTIASFSFFIIVYYLFNGDAGAAWIWPTLFGCVGALITTFIVIPIVAVMSKKKGKKPAFIISQAISIIGYILLWFLFIPGKPYLFLFALPFFSFGIGGLFTLMMSMTADVIDLDELETGLRREGIFGAIYWWMVKFGLAFAGLLSGFIMWLVDFSPNAEVQTEASITGMRFFFSFLPIAGTLGAMYIMRNYNLTETRAGKIRAELEAKKARNSGTSTYSQIDKLLALSALNFTIDAEVDTEFNLKTEEQIQELYLETLNTGVFGLCFSPYREGQTITDTITESQILQRLNIIKPYTNWIRTFSCANGNEKIPSIAKSKGLKTMVGAWIGNHKNQNEKEINTLISLAQKGMVDIAVIGNETLLRNEITEKELINYIQQVKEKLPHIPVGYVDAYFQFHERPNLVEACDVILANCYPFWEGYDINEASVYLQQMYNVLQQAAKGKPIYITETGWPSQGSPIQNAEPSALNAMKYFITTNQWASKENIPLFYFSSFDESWKIHQEGDVGNRWGIWDTKEQLKFK